MTCDARRQNAHRARDETDQLISEEPGMRLSQAVGQEASQDAVQPLYISCVEDFEGRLAGIASQSLPSVGHHLWL